MLYCDPIVMMGPQPLLTIPVLNVPVPDEPGVASALAEPARLALLLDAGRRTYTPVGMRLADARSRAWSARSTSPYGAAVAEVDRAIGRPGGFPVELFIRMGLHHRRRP
jgi:hypothetical protein